MLKISTIKTKYGYRGKVTCYDDVFGEAKRIWAETIKVDRTCREDAIDDAEHRKRDFIATGHIG